MTRPDGLHGGHAVAAALLLGACLLGRSARATTEVPAGTYDTVTWTAAGNPYKILGNLTITQLTVEAGTEVLVQVPGVGASYSISVTTLVVNGTPASPVTFQGDAAGTAQSAWRGLWVAGSASVTGAIVRNASDGIRLSATVTPTPSSTISRTRFEYDSYAVIIEGGDVTIDAITAVTLNHGIWNDQGKTVRLTNSLFRDTFNPIISRVGSFTITNCTILHAPTAAVDFSPASTTATLQILNTIIANGTTGVRVPAAASGQITIAYSDIFGNVVNLDGAQLGEGNISADPAAYNVTDYHLYPTSPCIDKGRAAGAPDHDLDFVARPKGAGVDMGAYEYDPAGGRGGAGGAASGGAGGGGGGAGGSAGAGGGGRGGSAGAGGSGGGSGGSAGATGGSAGAGGSVIGGSGGSAGATGGAAGRGGATGTAGTAGGATGTAGTAGGTTGIAGAAGGTGGATGAGGRGGAAGSAGVGGVGGSAGGAAGGAGGHPTTPAGNDGCGCRTVGTPADAFAGVLWLLAFLPIARPRRRRAR